MAISRMFNGKKYLLTYQPLSKEQAERDAKQLRENGYLARVVRGPGAYGGSSWMVFRRGNRRRR